jgi:hypothetical protein
MGGDQTGVNRAFSRRQFMLYTAGAAGVVAYGDLPRSERLGDFEPDAVVLPKPDYALIMRRNADQCVLTIGLWNMTPDFTTTPPVLKQIDPTKPSYLTVTPGVYGYYVGSSLADSPAPQNLVEESYPIVDPPLDNHSQHLNPSNTPSTTSPVAEPAVPARVAGPSTLAFVVPASFLAAGTETPILLDADHLLSFTGFQLSVVPAALPPLTSVNQGPKNFAGLRLPSATETAIEMPYRVVLSPPAVAAAGIVLDRVTPTTVFLNATQPVTSTRPGSHDQWTELWHTRMGVRHSIVVKIGNLEVEETVIDETTRNLMTARAVYCLDPNFASDYSNDNNEPAGAVPGAPEFHHPSLRYADRFDIVRLSSDFTATPAGPFKRQPGSGQTGSQQPFIPKPATVDRLMLSSLGGWLEADAHWDLAHAKQIGKTYNTSLLSWRHRATQGRDSYVRVVRKGYLFPWGHLASLITITEREFASKNNLPGAYLRQKTFIVVSGPVKSYGGPGDFAPWAGRGIPFTSVEALTLVTPPISEGGTPAKGYTNKQGGNVELCFVPKLSDGSDFLFHMRGTDWAGNPVDFHTPVVWVDDTMAYGEAGANATFMNAVINNWNASRPPIPLHNQRVSVASPSDISKASDSEIVISNFLVGADHPRNGTTSQNLIDASLPAFYPSMHEVTINHPEAAQASGQPVGASTMQFYGRYLNHGFDPSVNKGAVFLHLAPGTTRQKIVFKSDHAGGAITPNLGVDGMSRAIGPVSAKDIDDIADGNFTPENVFPTSGPDAINAKLLGGIELATILKQVPISEDSDNAQAMTIVSTESANPKGVVTTVDWHPVILPGGPTGAAHLFVPTDVTNDSDGSSDDSMDLHAVIFTSSDPNVPSTTTVTGQIRNFDINLFGNDEDNGGATYFIKIPFDSLTFRSQTGKKTDVQVQVNADGVAFVGALSFVQDLASYLNFDGSGLTINTAGSAITADLTLAIPNITVGVFSLNNIAFSAGVAIPYNGDPVVFDFSFCSEENPFQLDIMIFTGGGFVTLTIGATGVQSLAVGFDFGLGYSLDIGIASGEISLVGGVSFSVEQASPGQDVSLTAYVKASGGISALGVVSVSVELYLGMTYDFTTGDLIGEATLTISVHILFFGFSVGIDMQESFAGSGSSGAPPPRRHPAQQRALAGASPDFTADPTKPNTFGGSMTQPQWATYCSAFAPV